MSFKVKALLLQTLQIFVRFLHMRMMSRYSLPQIQGSKQSKKYMICTAVPLLQVLIFKNHKGSGLDNGPNEATPL